MQENGKKVEEQEIKKVEKDLKINKSKIFFNIYIWWRRVAKAKKMTRMILKDPSRYSEEYRYKWMQKIARKIIKLLNIEIDVFGIENWLDRGLVLVSNHQSNLDPILFLAINDIEKQQPVGYIAKKELWTTKIVKNFVNLIDVLPLDRKSPRSALEIMKEAKDLISQYKRSMVLFPEGTRSHSQELGQFHHASLKLGQMAYAPVVPVSIIDSHKAEEEKKGKKLHVKVVFGKPMMPDKFIAVKTETLSENVKKEIQKNINKYEDIDLKSKNIRLDRRNKKANCNFYKEIK